MDLPIIGQWHRDREGNIVDPEGHQWFGEKVEVANPREDKQVLELNPNQKMDRVVRFYRFGKMYPNMDTRNAMQIYHSMERFIKDTLFDSGLTTDDNYPPVIVDKGKECLLRIVAKPSGRRVSIYSGTKGINKMLNKVKGLTVRGETILQNKK